VFHFGDNLRQSINIRVEKWPHMSTTMSPLKKWVSRFLKFVAVAAVMTVGLGLGSYAYFSRNLPDPAQLKTFRPPQVSKVTCSDGAVCAEYFTQRRTWVDITKLPKHVADSFLAAEDADFYSHAGLDWVGIARSSFKNLVPGRMKSGASTISQQTCRGLLLTQERTLSRKMREWILTPRMEQALTKNEILNLYINTIYFGHNRYGLEEASQFYFGKSAAALSVGEAAVMAGTIQSPNRINPLTNIVKAKRRQRYVLGQLVRHGFLTQEIVEPELEKPIVLGPRPPAIVGAYYAEEVRRNLLARYGEKLLNEGGLKVEIAMDVKKQAAAEEAVKTGLEAVDLRAGYRGPVGHIELSRFEALRGLLKTRLLEAGRRKPDEVLVADLTTLKDDVPADDSEESEETATLDEPIPTNDEKLVRAVGVKTLAPLVETVGIVVKIEVTENAALVDVVSNQIRIPWAGNKWNKRVSEKGLLAVNNIEELVEVGDLVRVRLGASTDSSTPLSGVIVQLPKVQGALVSIDPLTRNVVALVGGYDASISAFNRATQAQRQPGSSFKPFLYGAAMASKKFTPVSIVNDAPEAIRDSYTGKMWKPQNYEKGGFEGPMTLRTALTKSKNTVSVRLIEALTPKVVIEFARLAGIKSPLPENLTLALGTGEVSPLEIANAYATLHSGGAYADAIVIKKVTDLSGRVLEEHVAAFEPRIDKAAAFLTTSLMRSVVEEGTAVAVLELKRPAAGKTGTAQEFRDAWFSGFTMENVTTAWVGQDDHSPIGPSETGGKAALPIWLHYMRTIHQRVPVRDFAIPEGIVSVRVNPQNGLLAGAAMPGRVEYFMNDTAPTILSGDGSTVDVNDFIMQGGANR
jgi:penicillin-binding protein 1A